MNKIDVRVYYEDTDAGGVVYYANYLKYIERGRTEFLRDLGFDQGELIAQDNVLFIVRSIEANYLSPALFNDLIEVQTKIFSISHASLVFSQKIMNIEKNTVLFNAKVKVVSVLNDNFKPCGFPPAILEKLNGRK